MHIIYIYIYIGGTSQLTSIKEIASYTFNKQVHCVQSQQEAEFAVIAKTTGIPCIKLVQRC